MLRPTRIGELQLTQPPSAFDKHHHSIYHLLHGQLQQTHLHTQHTQSINIRPHRQPTPTLKNTQLLTISGQPIINVDHNIISNNSQQVILRSELQICNGSSWQWFAPLSLQGIKLGVCHLKQNEAIQYQLFEFNSSTSRTITFSVQQNQLNVLINGNKPKKNHSKTISYDSDKNKWFPCVKIQQKGNTIVYLPFSTYHEALGISHFNIFGKQQATQPEVEQVKEGQSQVVNIRDLIQISHDKFLIIWENNHLRIIQRNPETHQFDFISLHFDGQTVANPFQAWEYDKLRSWRGQKALFPFSKCSTIKNLLQWLKFLLLELQGQKVEDNEISKLILSKIALIRPYAQHLNLRIPNLIPISEYDLLSSKNVLKYFNQNINFNNLMPASYLRSFTEYKIQGKILDCTENYLVTINLSNIIIYSIKDTLVEVFRNQIDSQSNFSKFNLVESYEESDIQNLKNQSSFLYKILMGCLQKEKKYDEPYLVNDNDVKELVRDYGIDQSSARTALQHTGHVEQALVWIFTDKNVQNSKKSQIQNQIESKKSEAVRIVQIQSQFGKLILQKQNRLFLLGVQPKETKNWVYKGERQYIDLSSFKHEDDLNLLNSNKWYLNGKHPKLSLLDILQTKNLPHLLYKEASNIYYLYNSEGTYYKNKILFDSNLVYQAQNSLSQQQEKIPLEYSHKEKLDKTRKGELICDQALPKSKYLQKTIWVKDNHIYDNIETESTIYSKCSYSITQLLPGEFSQLQSRIPFIVESGPPSCNHNYSITSILQPNSSFLANYQQKVILKHLHHKLFNLSSFSISRSKNRKNVNYITEGRVHFVDQWGNKSREYLFQFNEDEVDKTIEFQKDDYWKYIVIAPIFTRQEKLPFQFGFMTGLGSSVHFDSYKTNILKKIKKEVFTQSHIRLSIIKILNKTSKEIQILVGSKSEQEVLQACTEKANLKYLNKAIKPVSMKQAIQIQQLEPSAIIKELTINSTKTSILLRNISYSSTFSFKEFSEIQMNKFIDLSLYYVGSESEQYFAQMFNKLWNNQHGKTYLLKLSQHLTEFPTIPLPYLQLIISKLSKDTLQSTISSSLSKLDHVRSKNYQQLSKSKSPYLVFENQFYSKHYFQLIQPENKVEKKKIFAEPYINNEIAVFKSENSRKFVVKLSSEHVITNLIIKAQPCQVACKINYFVYVINGQGKHLVCQNRIFEHQWSYFTKYFNKPEIQALFDSKQQLNTYGLQTESFVAQYIQIQFFFTQTGIISHNTQASKVPQIDIIPQFYGYPTGDNLTLQRYDQLFVFNNEQLYFLSVHNLGSYPLQKYSVCKAKFREYIYFRLQKEDEISLRKNIEERIEKRDYDLLDSLQKRLLKNVDHFSNKVNLDYLYTLFALSFNALDVIKYKLNDKICEEIFSKLVSMVHGPIKGLAFKAIAHKTSLLMKSLQYVEQELPSLGKIDFSYEQLVSIIDLNNTDLCLNLSKLIIRVVKFQPKWAQLLIKMSDRTQINEEIIKYFIVNDQWLENNEILRYIAFFTQQFYQNYFLNEIKYLQLSKFILKETSKERLEILLSKIIVNASQENHIDLDVVSLIFKEEDIRWEQLEKVISCCPQAVDTIIYQFLQAQNSSTLAIQYHKLLTKASEPKYAEEFAFFLDKIYKKDQKAFVNIFLSIDNLTTLHYDFLHTVTDFIINYCNLGGIQGIIMTNQQGLRNIYVAVDMLKLVQKNIQGAELPNQENLLQWYLDNNDYEYITYNPANRSPGYHLLRQLVDSVFNILKYSSPTNVLTKYAHIVQKLKKSTRLNLIKKHLLFNKLHHGATKLLAHTINPGSLAQVFVGSNNPLLSVVLNELKANVLKKTDKQSKWKNAKEIDISEHFEISNISQEVKDIQLGKNGSKNTMLKVPVSQKIIRLSSKENHSISKFIIGFCLNDHLDNKTAVFPSRIEIFGGSENSLSKIGQLHQIQDQFYLSYGVKLFGINLNINSPISANSIQQIQLRIQQPNLCSVSEILKNEQKSKKNATFNLSFISIVQFDNLPQSQPDYSQLYVTLLGFLGQQKYISDLKKVVFSDIFDQKLELIIQVLNDLLPNQEIQNLLLSLNKVSQNVLQNILRSKNANPKLVKSLILGKLTKQNISKLMIYTFSNTISQQFVNIVVMSLRLVSYQQPTKNNAKNISDFNNIQNLMEKYQKNINKKEGSMFYQILTTLLTVPNIFNYEISKFINNILAKTQRRQFYTLLASILPYYSNELKTFLLLGNTVKVFDELIAILLKNNTENSIQIDPLSQISLINSLSNDNQSRSKLLQCRAPIRIVNLLKSSTSLLLKYSSQTMKQFISFFQNTCVRSQCQDEFSEILIDLMTSLNNFEAIHHQYFIQNFFFPLINAFQGSHLFFVWKESNNYIWQPTEILKANPIKSSSKIISRNGKFYEPIENLQEETMKNELLIVQNKQQKVLFKLQQGELSDAESNKKIAFSFKQSKIVLENGSDLSFPNEIHKIYQLTTLEHNLLTNATLLNLKNPWILQEKYRAIQALKSSTSERCYFVPLEMKLSEILKQINISGFRIHPKDLENIIISDANSKKLLNQNLTFREVLQSQKLSFIKLEIQASSLFKSITVETLATQNHSYSAFVTQQTIFKAFEQKKGLQKLIKVLTGCVKNWTNVEQSKIWGQYLKELQSYSCFPVFSSLYMTKESNVSLLFDLLLGLPDKQDSKKWLQKQKQSVKELYMIIKDVFSVSGQNAAIVRKYALNNGFYSTMLNRLHLITKEPKRVKVLQQKEQEVQMTIPNLQKKDSEQEYKDKLKKRKGVGYGTDSSTNQKWDVTSQEQARKQQSQQILGLLKILQKIFDTKDFEFPASILDETYESAILPIIESSLRGGSLLEISKYAELFQGELSFIQVLCKCKILVPTLMDIPKIYEPKQPESLQSLLKTLANTSKIFLSCLTGSASEKVSEQIATSITTTFEKVVEAITEYETTHVQKNVQQQQKKILQLPLGKKYPLLLKDLRFDYIDMKDNTAKITKHHYASYYNVGHKSPVQKTIRLAQELADISHALPIDHTNAIFVRCDKERVDYMQALIMGSNGTPYGHGAYLFDIYFQDTYPNGPPKVNLTTTGSGQIRFNPNLYACGKVCLSLLGTWRGNAMENWDAKVSTLLQVLVSIQSIIMSEDIYFNEPGFEHEQGTPQGQKKNQAYANIVRYGNVKFAMLQNIKKPPKGFETIIRRHFYLKKDEILLECQKWLKAAQKRQASYNGLVSDHNHNWCNSFKKTKTEYKTMLEKAVKELQIQLNKLPPPTNEDFKNQSSPAKIKKVTKQTKGDINKGQTNLQEIDMSYGGSKEYTQLDINDEKVKDRWSRYIGAMGVQAVSKQSKANILLFGLGGLGVEIAKNLVLGGCKEFTISDTKIVDWCDLSGQFFLGETDIGKSRLQSTIYKLQELNHYVKVSKLDFNIENLQSLSKYQVVIATQLNHEEQVKINQYCRGKNIKFIAADCFGVYGQLFNDFGQEFQVLDKNGEEPVEVFLEEITNGQIGVVKMAKGLRHPYEDHETIRITGVKGMKSLTNESQNINGTLHKIKVIDQFSFSIGNTLDYTPYEGDGMVRNLKTPSIMKFKSLQQSSSEQNIDPNLQYYDFSKGQYLRILHNGILALSQFKLKNKRLPLAWSKQDAQQLIKLIKQKKEDLSEEEIKYLKIFSYTCSGNFGPICAFFGGITAQETFKAITGKYNPINQYYVADFSEVIESPPEDQAEYLIFAEKRKTSNHRTDGIIKIIGRDLLNKLENAKVFMVGSGAIGCELLKNYAMLEIGTGENNGSITVTDPDHIETSNLNRQFLFREKHLRKPKSTTAAAAAIQMNPRLKGHIKARLDKVCQATKDIFSNDFFESLTIVTNALDNVQARRYVDSRCVESKIALLESGTLSSKGHVQVIIPYKTQTYGSKQDPNDVNGQVPHCTLKMFPEEILHCIEWARDLFGKEFTLSPKALTKLFQAGQTYTPSPSDIQMLKDCIKMLQNRPTNYEEAIYNAAKTFYQIYRNDIKQLLYTYPLDAKTKDGKLFWRFPKRPPTPIEEIDPEDPLHSTFITSYAVLLSKIYKIPCPKDFRQPSKRLQTAKLAKEYKIQAFIPSDTLAKQMTEQVDNENNKQKNLIQEEQAEKKQQGEIQLYERFNSILSELRYGGQVIDSKAEEFQKDEDGNGHIDLIFSMSNLRARNYSLEEMEWINVKLKAGRIMAALSTTTSCIAALQTIELVKYIKGCAADVMRNAFINLAVPVFQLSQPGQVQKIKVHQTLNTNLWERWSVNLKPEQTIGQFITSIEAKYGITVKGLDLLDGGQVYSDIVLSLESKKAEKEILLGKQLKLVLSELVAEENLRFADFILLMAVGQNLIKHAPTLRLILSQ